MTQAYKAGFNKAASTFGVSGEQLVKLAQDFTPPNNGIAMGTYPDYSLPRPKLRGLMEPKSGRDLANEHIYNRVHGIPLPNRSDRMKKLQKMFGLFNGSFDKSRTPWLGGPTSDIKSLPQKENPRLPLKKRNVPDRLMPANPNALPRFDMPAYFGPKA